MDCLARYIQQGKQLKNAHLTLIFGITALVLGGLIYALSYYTLTQPRIQALVRDIPTVVIRNATVIEPQNTVWRQTIPDTPMGLLIDTTTDELTETPERNTAILTRKKYYISFENEAQVYDLPTESLTIDQTMLQATLKNALYRLTLMTTGLAFILLWIGYLSVYFLTRVFLWSIKKPQIIDTMRRSALVGWVAVLILDLILIFSRHSFGLNWAILAATLISVFSVYLTTKND